jgi:hypothetical protein
MDWSRFPNIIQNPPPLGPLGQQYALADEQRFRKKPTDPASQQLSDRATELMNKMNANPDEARAWRAQQAHKLAQDLQTNLDNHTTPMPDGTTRPMTPEEADRTRQSLSMLQQGRMPLKGGAWMDVETGAQGPTNVLAGTDNPNSRRIGR